MTNQKRDKQRKNRVTEKEKIDKTRKSRRKYQTDNARDKNKIKIAVKRTNRVLQKSREKKRQMVKNREKQKFDSERKKKKTKRKKQEEEE